MSLTKNEAASNKNWSELPPELLHTILKRLSLVGFVRFRSVCSSWCTAADSYLSSFYAIANPCSPFHQTLWLLLPPPTHRDDHDRVKHCSSTSLRFLSFDACQILVHSLNNMFPKELGRGRASFMGCSFSGNWLIIHNKSKSCNIFHLVNPFTRTRIQLPRLQKVIYDAHKAIVFSPPNFLSSSNDFKIVLMFRGSSRLSFYKHGDKSWTHNRFDNNDDDAGKSYSDVALHNGRIYALSTKTSLIDIWNFGSLRPVKVVEVKNSATRLEPWINRFEPEMMIKSYLVESMGLLLVLDRIMHISVQISRPRTLRFLLHKLDYGGDLPGLAFFVCGHSAVSVLIRDFPELEMNSVYYFDDEHDLRRFDLKEQICVTYGLGNYSDTDFAFRAETIRRDSLYLGFFK